MDALADRFAGCLLGAAVGGAFGMPLEFLSRHDIWDIYGGPVVDMLPPGRGRYNDNTRLMIALAQAITEAGFPDPYAIADKFAELYRSSGNNRMPGCACIEACARLAQGEYWDRAGSDSADNGAATRIMPIALMYHGDIGRMLEFAREQSIITHKDRRAVEGAQLIALAIDYLLDRRDPAFLIDYLLAYAAADEIKGQLDRVKRLISEDGVPCKIAEGLGTSGYIVHTLGVALYSFLKCPDDLAQAVVIAANAGGDADGAACITGALAGAYNGEKAIPPDWLKDLENRGLIEDLARRLYDMYLVPYKPVPDILDYGLKAVFIGFNPGLTSAKEGHYYAYPGNHFWKLLYESGILPEPLSAKKDRRVLEFGYGMVDIVKFPTRSAADITKEQYRRGRVRLMRALAQYRPKLACYNGKTIYAKLTGEKKVDYGLQPDSAIEEVTDFVAMSSSPASAIPYSEKLKCYKELANLLESVI